MASIQAHEEFLVDVKARMSALDAEMAKLRAVAEFHAGEITRQRGANGAAPMRTREQHGHAVPPHLTKHEAVRIALGQIGRPAKVAEIAAVLRQSGYARGMKDRSFVNGLFTALNRRKDMFISVDRGIWALTDAAKEEGEPAG